MREIGIGHFIHMDFPVARRLSLSGKNYVHPEYLEPPGKSWIYILTLGSLINLNWGSGSAEPISQSPPILGVE